MFAEKINTRAKEPFQSKTWSGITPIGTARFPHLKEPHSFSGEDPRYKVGLILDEKDADAMEAFANEALDWAYDQLTPAKKKGTKKVSPVKEEMRKVNAGTEAEDLEPTGNRFFEAKTFSTDHKGNRKFVPMVDSNGNGLSDPPDVPGGSRLRLSVTFKPYWMSGNLGLTVYLNAVQIVELSQGYSDAAAFGAVEGGWTSNDGQEQVAAGTDFDDTPF